MSNFEKNPLKKCVVRLNNIKMRRSRSSSSIPMPMSLQKRNDARTRERARSQVRFSREKSSDGHTPLAHQRLMPDDRKYSIQRNLLRTPTTPCSSYSGLTRGSSMSSVGSRMSVTPKGKKTLQKLMTDKKWVAGQYSKVQDFIQNSGLFNPELAGKIRPPTMATFTEIISVLFRKLVIKTPPINLQNYGEIVLQTLKLLKFPGQITASTVKTVNTMHGWPQFITIISWLIERVNLESIYNNFKEQQEDEVKANLSMFDAVFGFLSVQHYIESSEEKNDEYFLESEYKLYDDMIKITGTDCEAASKIRERVERERAQEAESDRILQEIEEENLKLKAQIEEKQVFIHKYEDNKGKREQELKEELEQLKKTAVKNTEKINVFRTSIKELEDRISKQSCKFEEKVAMVNEIEDVTKTIERKQRKLNEYRIVRDDLDHELKMLITQIESKVDAWNVAITKTFLPEMNALHLREKGFHSEEFLKEIEYVLKRKGELEEHFFKEYQSMRSELEKVQKQHQSLVETNEDVDAEELENLRRSIKVLEEKNKEIKLNNEEFQRSIELNIKKVEESQLAIIKEQELTIAQLTDRKKEMIEDMERVGRNGLAVIVKARNMALEFLQKPQAALRAMTDEAREVLRARAQQLQESMEHLANVRKTNEELKKSMGPQ